MADVVVAGSINIDLAAAVPHLPWPGETVIGARLTTCPGGKGANQAVAAARAGASVRMLGAVGDDTDADEARSFLGQAGVDIRGIATSAGRPTGMALIVVAEDGQNSIVVVPGANHTLDEITVRAVPLRQGDVLVTQFETPLESAMAFFQQGRQVGATCILNPAPARPIPLALLELVERFRHRA